MWAAWKARPYRWWARPLLYVRVRWDLHYAALVEEFRGEDDK